MHGTMEWDWYRAFLAVLECGSLSAAARHMGVTQPTVGRHIAAMEDRLGQALFLRGTTGLVPTDLARTLQPLAAAMASHATALERAGARDTVEVRGVVRLSASDVVGAEVLPPILAALGRAHPALVVELVLSNTVHDLMRRDADLAVRMTTPRQEQLIARRIGDIELGLFAHPDYLRSHGVPGSLATLGQGPHALIGYDQPNAYLRALESRFPVLQRERFTWRTDSDLAQLSLIRAGAGIGVCQSGLAARAPQLQRVVPDEFSLHLPVWVVMHEDLRDSPSCRVTFDAVVQGLTHYVAGQGGSGAPD